MIVQICKNLSPGGARNPQPVSVADWLRYSRDVLHIEDLLGEDLGDASKMACNDLFPDLVAALDTVLPRMFAGDRIAVRRYVAYIDVAIKTLTELPALEAATLPSADVVSVMLRNNTVEFPWVAPSFDGAGVVTVLVDRLRGCTAGIPPRCVRASEGIDVHFFDWFAKQVSDTVLEREQASPLRRAMTILDLSSADIGRVMHVQRQAVDKWLLAGPPADRASKIAAIAQIADVLRHRLKPGLPAAVVRRPAVGYGDRTMLQVIEDDDHEWLLKSVRDSFDFRRVA